MQHGLWRDLRLRKVPANSRLQWRHNRAGGLQILRREEIKRVEVGLCTLRQTELGLELLRALGLLNRSAPDGSSLAGWAFAHVEARRNVVNLVVLD